MGQEKTYMIVLVGEAGSGKDTIADKLCEAFPDMAHKVVTWTTRPQRSYEEQDVDYHFVDHSTFQAKRAGMLEYDQFNKWFYGTHVKSLKKNKVNIGVYTPNGCRKLIAYDDLYPIFVKVECNSKTRVLRQIERDENVSVREVCRRYLADEEDFSTNLGVPYHTIYNESQQDLDDAVKDIGFIIKMLYNFLIEEEENN